MAFRLEDKYLIKSLRENKKYGVKCLLKTPQTHSTQLGHVTVSAAFLTGLETDLQLGG